jgi:hypothetical protein
VDAGVLDVLHDDVTEESRWMGHSMGISSISLCTCSQMSLRTSWPVPGLFVLLVDFLSLHAHFLEDVDRGQERAQRQRASQFLDFKSADDHVHADGDRRQPGREMDVVDEDGGIVLLLSVNAVHAVLEGLNHEGPQVEISDRMLPDQGSAEANRHGVVDDVMVRGGGEGSSRSRSRGGWPHERRVG